MTDKLFRKDSSANLLAFDDSGDGAAGGPGAGANVGFGARFQSALWEMMMKFPVLSGRLGVLLMLLNSLQSFGIALTAINPADWDRGYADWMITVVDGVLLQTMLFGNMVALYVGWIAVGTLLLSMLAICFLNDGNRRDWTNMAQKIVGMAFQAIMGVFLYPLASLLASHTTCQSRSSAGVITTNPNCWVAEGSIVPLFSIFAFVVLLMLSVAKNIFLIETVAFDVHTLAKAHGRLDALEQVLNCVLIFLTTALRPLDLVSTTAIWAINIVCVVGTGGLTALHMLFGPYYYQPVQLFKTISSAFIFWFSICNLLLETFAGSGYEPLILLYFCSILIIFCIIWLTNHRRRSLMDRPIDEITRDYEVEMKIRFLMQQKKTFWTRQSNSSSNDQKPDTNDDDYREANVLYKQGLKKFPESTFICFNYGCFLFGKCNYNFCLTTFSKAKRALRVGQDQAFLMHKRSKVIEHIFSQQKGTMEVIRYFRFLELTRLTEAFQKKFTARKLALLAELKKSQPNPKKVQIFSCDFQKTLYQTQSAYHEMFSINPTSKVLRKYASFVSNMVGHLTLTKTIVESADKIDAETENNESKLKTTGLESQSALFDDRNAVFIISGDENRLGEILEVNLGAVDMFGFAVSSELVGANISTMMPSPFSENHNSFLRKYLETGYTSVLDTTRTVVARDKSGYIFEVRLYVRQIVDTKGDISFIGVMGKNDDQPEFIIIDALGHVFAVSKNVLSIFGAVGFDSDASSEAFSQKLRQVHISQWIGAWEPHKASFYKEQGHTISHRMSQMHVRAQRLDFIGSNFSVIEIWFEELQRSRRSIMDMHSRESIANMGHIEKPILSPESTSPPLTRKNWDVVKTAVYNDESSETSSKLAGFLPMRRGSDADIEAAETVLQNTAMNMVAKFDQLIHEYRSRMETVHGASASFSRFWFKFLGIGLIVWLIASNIQFNGLFYNIKSFVDDLKNNGIRNSEALRMMSSLRSIQIAVGCDHPALSSGCNVIHSGSNITYLGFDASRKALLSSSANLRDSNFQMVENIVLKRQTSSFFDTVVPLFEEAVQIDLVRYQSTVIKSNISLLETMEKMATSAMFLSTYADASKFYLTQDDVIQDVRNIGALNITEPEFYRSVFFLLANVRNVEEYFAPIFAVYSTVFGDTIDNSIRYLLILSIIPVALFMCLMAMFVVPDVRKLVIWQGDILTTMLNIPRSLIQWWYSVLIRKLEEDAKEEEDGVTAELYMYLQQGDLVESSEDNSGLVGKITAKEKSVKSRASEEATKSGKQTSRMRVNAGLALKAMNQKNIISKMVVSSIFLVIIPLISLVLLPSLINSPSLAEHLNELKSIAISLQEVHFDLRESYIYFYSNDSAKGETFFENILTQLRIAQKTQRFFVYGNPAVGTSGLGDSDTFKDVFFGNACQYEDPLQVTDLVIQESCESFDNGILTHGLNQALIEYEKRALNIINLLRERGDQSEVARKIVLLEALMLHIISIIRSIQPAIPQVLITTADMNANVIQPIQIVLAILATVLIYYRIYMPFMHELERDTNSMHSVLMTLWSVAESSNPNSGKDSSNARITKGENNNENTSGKSSSDSFTDLANPKKGLSTGAAAIYGKSTELTDLKSSKTNETGSPAKSERAPSVAMFNSNANQIHVIERVDDDPQDAGSCDAIVSSPKIAITVSSPSESSLNQKGIEEEDEPIDETRGLRKAIVD